MSPQKPSRPRVSDDTALLQAFLNRAAESKSSRRISTSKRESMTNRRDSGAVRQALASPAKADVLADLDPNSPSPRKASASNLDNGSTRSIGIFDDVPMGEDSSSNTASQDEQQMDMSRPAENTRRSGRATTKKCQTPTPMAPNKIAIRGNADGVVLKRSEAQEMALLTRNNTRKNKGGSVLPPFRLTKLASQTSNLDVEMTAENGENGALVNRAEGVKGVKWAETLVEFYQGGEVSESSILSDELNAASAQQAEQAVKADSDAVAASATPAAPPPPSETPSKPKIRRLKPPRTAATPGKGAQAPIAPTGAEAEKQPAAQPPAKDKATQQTPAPKPAPSTKKRTRIATPAKLPGGVALLPSDAEPLPAAAPTEKKPPRPPQNKKKAPPASKLPAPASIGQGKENQNQTLTSSPPKKRPANTNASVGAGAGGGGLPTAKTFAPKLDFGSSGKTKLEPATYSQQDEASSVPGLLSPAKKGGGGRERSVFGASGGMQSSLDFGGKEQERQRIGVGDELPGLSSPAKKRTRRAG